MLLSLLANVALQTARTIVVQTVAKKIREEFED